MSAIVHPLALHTKVEARVPQCPCKGASFVNHIGTIQKVITNSSGIWYYLDTGTTIRSQFVQRIM